MGTRHYPDWIDAYVEYTSALEPCEPFRRWSAIGAISAAVQRKNWVIFNPVSGPVYANLYIMLVGEPASGKSESMRPARALLDSLNDGHLIGPKPAPISAMALRREQLVHEAVQQEREVQLNGRAFRQSPLAVFADELLVFLEHGSTDKLEWLCAAYDGTLSQQTFARGVEAPEGAYIAVMGGVTPGALADAIPKIGHTGGFISRCLIVCGDRRKRQNPFVRASDPEAFSKLSSDLKNVFTSGGEFRVSPECQDSFTHWYLHADEIFELASESNEPLDSYYGRRDYHLRKLMLLSAASRADHKFVIIEDDFTRARRWLDEADAGVRSVFKRPLLIERERAPYEILRYLASCGAVCPRRKLDHYFILRCAFADYKQALKELISLKLVEISGTQCKLTGEAKTYLQIEPPEELPRHHYSQ